MLIKDIISKEINHIYNIPLDNPYQNVIDMVLSCKGNCIFSGVGKAKTSALLLCEKFKSIGVPSFILDALNAQHGDIGVLKDGDILFIVSNSGKTRELLEIIELIKRMGKEIPIILITGNKNSDLGKVANIVLTTNNKDEMLNSKTTPLGLIPTISTTVITIIGNILTTLLIAGKEIQLEEYQYYHHSGYIRQIIDSNKSKEL